MAWRPFATKLERAETPEVAGLLIGAPLLYSTIIASLVESTRTEYSAATGRPTPSGATIAAFRRDSKKSESAEQEEAAMATGDPAEKKLPVRKGAE